MKPRVALTGVLLGMLTLYPLASAHAAAPMLTRSAILRKLSAQAVQFRLMRVVTVSDGHGGTLTVAEGATTGAQPLLRFFFWHGASFAGQIEGVQTRIASWSKNRITLIFGDVPSAPGGYDITYSWRAGRLSASARPPVQDYGGAPTTAAATLTVTPNSLAVNQTAELTVSGFAGPVSYSCASPDVSFSGSEVWADALGTYQIIATYGDETAAATIDVTGATAGGQGGTSASGLGIALSTPSVGEGETLAASVSATGANVFWWLTDQSEMQYPLFGSSTYALSEALPSYIEPGSYSLSAEVDPRSGTAATYTVPVTVTAPAGTLRFAGWTPFDVYNRQDMMPLFRQGFDGQGQTIVLFELSDVLMSDIDAFDQDFGLPAVDLQVVQPYGEPGLTAAQDEATMDIEWAHAMAPEATIVVYEYPQVALLLDALGLTAVRSADAGYTAMSVSYGQLNLPRVLSDLQLADAANKGLAIFASSGDHGQISLLNDDWPSDYLYVVSVGGLQYEAGGTTYWDSGADSSGTLWAGAYGRTFGEAPSWQQQLGLGSGRIIPDVSFLADGALEVINGETDGGGGGTSLASPMWAGAWCLAAQYFAAEHGGQRIPVPSGEAIYAVAASGLQTTAFSQAFNLQTGFGAPDVTNLAIDLSSIY